MKEYIEREMAMKAVTAFFEPVDTVDKAVILNHLLKKLMLPLAADVVSKAAFDQVMWERDVAIQQLRDDYGVGLGEKKAADAAPVRHGRWIKDGDMVVCSECGEEHAWDEYRSTYCEDCGAKMDLEGNDG